MMQKICEPLNPQDPYAVQHREQFIGAAPAFLKLFQVCEEDLATLQDLYKQKQEQNGNS